MKIAILTSGILPVPAVQGGAVEKLVDYYLEYNEQHHLHDITVYSIYHPLVNFHDAMRQQANHYEYIDTSSLRARLEKRWHGIIHRNTYYHYSIDYFFFKAINRIRRQKFDLIIVENRPGFLLKMHDIISVPIYVHLHNDFLNSSTPYGRNQYEFASRIITVSDFLKRQVQFYNPHDNKCFTVHNGIDLAQSKVSLPISRKELGFGEEDFVLVFCGRLIPEKGISELIEAMILLRDEPHIKLLIIGGSFYENSANDNPFISGLKVKAKEVCNNIRFTGYIKHEQVPSYLHQANVAVVPSIINEGFGLSIVESMAVGLPIITTNRGGISEVVSSDNAIVVTVDEDFPERLAEAILLLYHDTNAQREMGLASLKLSKQYSKVKYARNFFDNIDN